MSLLNKNNARVAQTTETGKARPKTPIYQSIKDHVLSKIQDDSWLEGSVIPSEESLAKAFDISRMTVNRALKELSNEGVLHRVQGSGTFVSERKYQAMLLQIKNIADEVSARGHVHHSDLQLLERCFADEFLAAQFNVPLQHSFFTQWLYILKTNSPSRWKIVTSIQ